MQTVASNWVNFLRIERLWGLDDPLFPATKVAVGDNLRFEAVGLDREILEQCRADPCDLQRRVCIGWIAVFQSAQL